MAANPTKLSAQINDAMALGNDGNPATFAEWREASRAALKHAYPDDSSEVERFDKISYDSAIERKLAVMDTTAFALCRDYRMPIRVYDLHKRGDLMRIIKGENVGTLVDQAG